MKKPSIRKPKKFTLLELLIVIAIISILAGLLMPVIGQVKRKAKLVECASNLRQVGIAFSSYLSENDSYYPIAAMKPSVSVGEPRICDVLLHSAGDSEEVFHCPEDVKPESSFSGNTLEVTFFSGEGCSYEYATMLSGRKEGAGGGPGNMSPVSRIVMFDYECFHRSATLFSLSQDESGSDSLSVTKRGGAKNYLFADWHVNDTL